MTPKDPEIKVTKIGPRWHCRLIHNGKILDETACSNSLDIGYCCREMLRMYNKCGNQSAFAKAARERLNQTPHKVTGRIWYKYQLQTLKAKNLSKKV